MPIDVTNIDVNPPFWTKVEGPDLGPERRIAALDTFSPGFAPPQQRLSEKAIASLMHRGLTEEGAYALRGGFGAGNLSDQAAVAELAITKGKFTAVQSLPSNDPGQGEKNACPYLGGMFGRDPAYIDICKLSELRLTEEEAHGCPYGVIQLLNRRGMQMQGESVFEDRQFNHDSLRSFTVEALRLAYGSVDLNSEEGDQFFEYQEEHLRPGDRLLDYAAFQALQETYGNPWWQWPDEVKRSDPKKLSEKYPLSHEIRFWLYVQWRTGQQWKEYAKRVHDVDGYTIMDRAYSVLPNNPEGWRSWREQYVEGKKGTFHIDPSGNPSHGSGANVEGDPYGAQGWGHLVLDFQNNPEGAIDFIVESIRPMAETADVIRIDHALAWVWKYYRIPQGKSAKEGEYIDALKHRIFQRVRKEFPNLYIICEDCGYSDDAIDKTLQECGADAMACLHWAPQGDSLNPRFAHPDEGPAKRTWITDNHDTKAIEEWFYGLKAPHQYHFMRMIHGNDMFDGRNFDAQDFVRWIFTSNKHIVVTTLRTVSSLKGRKDNRPFNVPGAEDPSFWQLICQKSLEELEQCFEAMGPIIENTRRSTFDVVHDDGKPRLLALSPRAGEQQHVRPGEVCVLRLAFNHLPEQDDALKITSNTPWARKTEESSWGDESIAERKYTRYKDGTYVCELHIHVPTNAPAGAYELAGSFIGPDGEQPLCAIGQNLWLVVEH